MNRKLTRIYSGLSIILVILGMIFPMTAGAASMELDYASFDVAGSVELDASDLWNVTDLDSAVKQMRNWLTELDDSQKTPANINLYTLFAEANIARASFRKFDGSELKINAENLQKLLQESGNVANELEQEFRKHSIRPVRSLTKTVTFITEEQKDWRILITIDPNIAELKLNTNEIYRIRIEVKKSCAIMLDLVDLQEDIQRTKAAIQIEMRDAREDDSIGSAFTIRATAGSLRHPIILSLSKNGINEEIKMIDKSANMDDEPLISTSNPAFDSIDASAMITLDSNGEICATFAPADVSFPDVDLSLGQKKYDAIIGLAEAGIVGGKDDGNFHPDDDVGRGQFAKMVMGVMNVKYSEYSRNKAGTPQLFPDVPQGYKLYDYVQAAATYQYVNGRNGKFYPSDKITYQQMYAIVGRIIKREDGYLKIENAFQKKYGQEATEYLRNKFRGVDNISEVFRDDIAYTNERGLLIPPTNSEFSNPGMDMNRGDTALILWNLMQKVRH